MNSKKGNRIITVDSPVDSGEKPFLFSTLTVHVTVHTVHEAFHLTVHRTVHGLSMHCHRGQSVDSQIVCTIPCSD